jgi:hypothetical protein
MRWPKARAAATVALCALVLAGCGGNAGSSENTAANRALMSIDVETANVEHGYQPDQDVLLGLSRRYAATVLKYKDALGAEGAKDRLTTKADELRSWCLPCAQLLLRERAKY